MTDLIGVERRERRLKKCCKLVHSQLSGFVDAHQLIGTLRHYRQHLFHLFNNEVTGEREVLFQTVSSASLEGLLFYAPLDPPSQMQLMLGWTHHSKLMAICHGENGTCTNSAWI